MIYTSKEEALAALRGNADPESTAESTVETMPNVEGLTAQQSEQYYFYESQVEKYGQYDPGILGNGAHYGPNSPFQEEGLICANCVFYQEGACEIVSGNIAPNGICKFWIIQESIIGEYNANT